MKRYFLRAFAVVVVLLAITASTNFYTKDVAGKEGVMVMVNYIVPKQKSYKIENPFSMWGWINARKLHPLCKEIEI